MPAVPARRRATAATARRAVVEAAPRIEVRKTYKLYIGGAFPRTESGRPYLVSAADGRPVANACRGSRKTFGMPCARPARPSPAGPTGRR